MSKSVYPSTIRFNLIRNRQTISGLYQVKMRISYAFGRLEIPVEISGNLLKCRLGDLQNNTYLPDVETNLKLQELALKALNLASLLKSQTTSAKFRLKIYSTKELVNNTNRYNLFDLLNSLDLDNRLRNLVNKMGDFDKHSHPSHHLEDFNLLWAKSFFQYLHDEGIYKPQTFEKMIVRYKALVKLMTKKSLINVINLADLKLSLFMKPKNLSGTRLQHNLRKEEVDHLLNFEFNRSDLNEARDMFILQTFAGGLRGFKEYNTLKLLKYSKDEFVLSFYQSKTDKTILNPLNCYTKVILERNNYKIPTINTSRNKDQNEQWYRERLKKVAELAGLDRMVKVDNDYAPIHTLFNAYWARKTFGTILYHHCRLREEEIALWTGHSSRNKGELLNSYIEADSVEYKTKLISNLYLSTE